MGSINVNTDEMDSTGSSLASEADNLVGELQRFNGQVQNLLAGGFRTPQASGAFEQSWQDFSRGYQSVVDGLKGLGSFLKSAGQAFTDTDGKLGSSLRGGK